jgi:hypothetical protein
MSYKSIKNFGWFLNNHAKTNKVAYHLVDKTTGVALCNDLFPRHSFEGKQSVLAFWTKDDVCCCMCKSALKRDRNSFIA